MLDSRARNAFLIGAALVAATTLARAQPVDPIGDLLAAGATQPASVDTSRRQTVARPLSSSDQYLFSQGLNAARRGDVTGARSAIGGLSDPVARKAVLWAVVDTSAEAMSFWEVDAARRDLAGFPRATRRQAAAEKLIETSGKSPGEIVAWFSGQEPTTPQGAMALASAYRSLGQAQPAAELIRRWWRDKSFEVEPQRVMLSRFSDVLTADDHLRRADILLYGAQGPAARELLTLISVDQQPAALARIAMRSDAGNANDLYNALTPALQASPGVAFERAAYLRRKGMDTLAVAQLASFPHEVATTEQADRIWDERYRLVLSALRSGDHQSAYQAAASSGLNQGPDATEAEFYAGWLALSRLNDPVAAGRHFAVIEKIGVSPITRGRAFYWEGRAAEARGDRTAADTYYRQGAQYVTTFYGQLSAEKLNIPLVLPRDPEPTAADRARFEGQDVVQAMRLFFDQGQRDTFRAFALHLDDVVPTPVEAALLIDLIRGYGDQDTSMKAVRACAQRGLILGDRGYPYRTPPPVAGAPEPALVLGITRQESGFDPTVRSGADARGLMQLLPSTAQIVARKMGVSYSASRLYEPDLNMQLGSAYLGQIVDRFSGSYIMAAAGYNAGPGRPGQWSAFCGDPRGGSADPLDFIECIPFSETRNYVMRVMENMQVYRAKLNGGTTRITLSQDLRRGAYGYSTAQAVDASTTP
jgi:soluble lytic murein transglycosylase